MFRIFQLKEKEIIKEMQNRINKSQYAAKYCNAFLNFKLLIDVVSIINSLCSNELAQRN